MRKILSTEDAALPGAAYSQGVALDGLVITAGQVGVNPVTGQLAPDLRSQVRQAVANLEAVLMAGGAGLADLVKVTCFLQNIEDFADFDEEYRALVPAPFPGRSAFGVDLAGDLLFEVEAIAVRKPSSGAESGD